MVTTSRVWVVAFWLVCMGIMCHASQTAPHLSSPVAAQTPVMQDPSTSTSCAGLTHPQAPNLVTTATVGGSALREKVYTHTHTHTP